MLRARGFVPDMRQSAPICRWQVGAVVVDVMPTLEEILGFANRWYPLALETAVPVALPSARTVRLIAAPVFVATRVRQLRSQVSDLLSSDFKTLPYKRFNC